MATLLVACDKDTEALLQSILDDLDQGTLAALEQSEVDNIEVVREFAPTSGLTHEPITVAATITLAAILVPRVARIIERWMEHQRQLRELNIVADGFDRSDTAGKALAHVAEIHAKVAIAYRLEQSPKVGGRSGRT